MNNGTKVVLMFRNASTWASCTNVDETHPWGADCWECKSKSKSHFG